MSLTLFIDLFKMLNILDFGDEEVHLILEKYENTLKSAGVNVDKVDMEWIMLKKAFMEGIISAGKKQLFVTLTALVKQFEI